MNKPNRFLKGFLGGIMLGSPIIYTAAKPYFHQPVSQTTEQPVRQVQQTTQLNLEHLAKTSPTIQQPAKSSYATDNLESDPDDILLARLIFGEARGCSRLEKQAVAYTVINRANDNKKWNGTTIKEAALKPWQYSCFNKNDPNRKKLMNPDYNKQEFEDCLEVAREVISGKVKDPTNGATHYFNPNVVKPSWARKLKKIGNLNGRTIHEFYKED